MVFISQNDNGSSIEFLAMPSRAFDTAHWHCWTYWRWTLGVIHCGLCYSHLLFLGKTHQEARKSRPLHASLVPNRRVLRQFIKWGTTSRTLNDKTENVKFWFPWTKCEPYHWFPICPKSLLIIIYAFEKKWTLKSVFNHLFPCNFSDCRVNNIIVFSVQKAVSNVIFWCWQNWRDSHDFC